MLAAWQGREQEAVELIQATIQEATPRGTGILAGSAAYASAVLHNGLGRYDAARDAAQQVFERDDVIFGYLVVAELAEAAARTGDIRLVQAALDWLSERTRVTPTAWVLGIEARIRALLSDGQAADGFYRESVERLGRTRVRAELARSHLLYGEWLRRERRRAEAREQLRTAHRMLEEMGMEAFAERARRELRATGDTARTRAVPAARAAGASDGLTAQEAQVARLAREGLSNPEIGARLFHQPAHRPVPPQPRLHQARHHVPQPARPRAARRPGYRRAALAPPPPWSWPSPCRAKPWPVALCSGGSGRGPAELAIAGMESPRERRHASEGSAVR